MADFEKDFEDLFKKVSRESAELRQLLWSALANVVWIHEDGTYASYSFRSAGGWIAEMSGAGDYLSYYCNSPYAVVTPNIAAALESRGWKPFNWPERGSNEYKPLVPRGIGKDEERGCSLDSEFNPGTEMKEVVATQIYGMTTTGHEPDPEIERRAAILKECGLSPKSFCPACWAQVKKLLRKMEE
jgi:hypothetical protein